MRARLDLLLPSSTVLLLVCTVSDRRSNQSWHALDLLCQDLQQAVYVPHPCWPVFLLKDLEYICWPSSPFTSYTCHSSGLCTPCGVFVLMGAAHGLVLENVTLPWSYMVRLGTEVVNSLKPA